MAQTFLLSDDGVVPNNPVLAIVVMPAVVEPDPRAVELAYLQNDWEGVWAFTIFDYLHYHPDAHEVLTCISGWGDVEIGGHRGRNMRLVPGDCVVLPAGTGHRLVQSSEMFEVMGAYPKGQVSPEIRRATRENYEGMPRRIANVPLPTSCPIFGTDGPTMQAWSNLGI